MTSSTFIRVVISSTVVILAIVAILPTGGEVCRRPAGETLPEHRNDESSSSSALTMHSADSADDSMRAYTGAERIQAAAAVVTRRQSQYTRNSAFIIVGVVIASVAIAVLIALLDYRLKFVDLQEAVRTSLPSTYLSMMLIFSVVVPVYLGQDHAILLGPAVFAFYCIGITFREGAAWMLP